MSDDQLRARVVVERCIDGAWQPEYRFRGPILTYESNGVGTGPAYITLGVSRPYSHPEELLRVWAERRADTMTPREHIEAILRANPPEDVPLSRLLAQLDSDSPSTVAISVVGDALADARIAVDGSIEWASSWARRSILWRILNEGYKPTEEERASMEARLAAGQERREAYLAERVSAAVDRCADVLRELE